MKLKTLQDKAVINALKEGKTYYADYSKIRYSEYIKQWKMLAKFCGFSHCPIFCTPVEDDSAIEATFADTKSKNGSYLELDVPDYECRLMDYYDFSTWLYYSSGQEYDDYFNFDADQALNNIDKYITLGEYNSTPQVCIEMIKPEWVIKGLNESVLLEKTRAELISKSKSANITKSYGTTRYDRRNVQHVYNPESTFNKLDMNALWKANILTFSLPVQGEHDNYNVEILFDGILQAINRELKNNNYVLEYKVIYKAIIDAINKSNILVSCNCKDFIYRQSYWASKGRYNSGKPEIRPAKITNPNDTAGAGCKHIMKVIADLDWALVLASCINNYVSYMEEHYPDKYHDIIFPAIYSMSYQRALDQGLIENPDDDLDVDIEDEIEEEPIEEEPVDEEPSEEEEEDNGA